MAEKEEKEKTERNKPTQEQQDVAYKQAQERIAQCLDNGDTELVLNDEDLSIIPPEIEQCLLLTSLYCGDNQISDLSPLAGLSNLTRLDCYNNQISDLSPLAGLSNLTELNCRSNQISDLSPLAGLSNLTRLDCDNNQISDLSPLAGLSNLTSLYCSDNQTSDLSPLAGLSNLTELDCVYNRISDLSPLAGLSNLTGLDCGDNQISDLSPLAGLSKLTRLSFRDNPITESSEAWKYLAGLAWTECAKPTLAYLNGDLSVLPPELQSEAADIMAERLADATPMAEEIILNDNNQLEVKPAEISQIPLFSMIIGKVRDALEDAIEMKSRLIHKDGFIHIRLERALKRYSNDPQRVHDDFYSTYKLLQTDIDANPGGAVHADRALLDALDEGVLDIRDALPEVKKAFIARAKQRLINMTDGQKKVIKEQVAKLDPASSSDLQKDNQEDVEIITEETTQLGMTITDDDKGVSLYRIAHRITRSRKKLKQSENKERFNYDVNTVLGATGIIIGIFSLFY